jgi:hypothetical protein
VRRVTPNLKVPLKPNRHLRQKSLWKRSGAMEVCAFSTWQHPFNKQTGSLWQDEKATTLPLINEAVVTKLALCPLIYTALRAQY